MITYRENAKWTVYIHIVPKSISGYDWDKYYVGITGQKLERRWRSNGAGYKDSFFSKAIKKYTWNNIEHYIIANNITKEEAESMEKTLIQVLQSNNKLYGYNCTSGGEGTNGYKHTEEYKRKMSERFSGANNHMYGKHMSKESIEKRRLSINFKGKNNPMYGKHHTEETKRKIGLANSKKAEKEYYQSDEVYQFDKQLNFIDKYPSHRDASISLGVPDGNIGHAVRNEQLYAYDYIWRSKKDVVLIDNEYKPINLRKLEKVGSKVFQFDLETRKFMKYYNNINDLEHNTTYKKSTICSACNGTSKQAYGYIWRYEKDVIEKDGSFFITEN